MNNPRMQNCNTRCAKNTLSGCQEGRTSLCDGYPKVETAKDMVIAMAYVPWQHFNGVLEPDKALQMGTMFPELVKPFVGCKGGYCS